MVAVFWWDGSQPAPHPTPHRGAATRHPGSPAHAQLCGYAASLAPGFFTKPTLGWRAASLGFASSIGKSTTVLLCKKAEKDNWRMAKQRERFYSPRIHSAKLAACPFFPRIVLLLLFFFPHLIAQTIQPLFSPCGELACALWLPGVAVVNE